MPAGITAEGRAGAIAWTPPGFRAFDTGTVDGTVTVTGWCQLRVASSFLL